MGKQLDEDAPEHIVYINIHGPSFMNLILKSLNKVRLMMYTANSKVHVYI